MFLEHYSAEFYPLVSVLIPTFNREDYLKEALESVLQQSYNNLEIIISDDSTNDNTERMLQPYLKKHPKIKYFRNDDKLGKSTGLENGLSCLELARGDYISFLMDDDKYSPDKISKMVNYFLLDKDIKLVTSYRQLINGQGRFLNPIRATRKLSELDTIIDGRQLGNYVISNLINVIGEPTTVVFRKSDLIEGFGQYFGRQYRPLSDVSTWLQLLQKGKAVYISETLSYFRIHGGQNANDKVNMMLGATEWYYLIKDSYEHSIFIQSSGEFQSVLRKWLNQNAAIISQIKQLSAEDKSFEEENRKLIQELYNCYEDCVETLNRISLA